MSLLQLPGFTRFPRGRDSPTVRAFYNPPVNRRRLFAFPDAHSAVYQSAYRVRRVDRYPAGETALHSYRPVAGIGPAVILYTGSKAI